MGDTKIAGGFPVSILYILIPAAMTLALFFLAAFLWAVHRGQFDDLVTPAHKIFTDEDEIKKDLGGSNV